MIYTLFLDDIRFPDRFYYEEGRKVAIARNVQEAIDNIGFRGIPEVISFDHDLGEDGHGNLIETAMKFMWYLIDSHYDGKLDLLQVKQVFVHSANPVGSQNLRELWNGFARDINSDVRAVQRVNSETDNNWRR